MITRESINKLVRTMNDPSSSELVQLSAALAILDAAEAQADVDRTPEG